MSNIPANLKYTKTHEWLETLDDGTIRVGITDHAQELLGDMVFIELPAEGDEVNAAQECAVVESVKAASDVYAPLSGVITAVNETLADAPETVNTDPYGNGWLFCIRPSDTHQLDGLLDASTYEAETDD